jgi:hypothetical protein
VAKVKWIRLIGQRRKTKEVKNFISIFRDQTVKVVSRELGKGARDFAGQVRGIIKAQKYRWKPLSERWLRYKKKHGLDRRIHIATKTYVKSIRATPRRRKGKIVSWGVGPGGPNQIHTPSGLRFADLARILEFGSASRKIPPRPHWRPAWSAFVRRDSKVLAKNAVRAAYREAIAKSRLKRR